MNEKKLLNGYIQIYTGDGKGKTTAALGLALRAVGAGLKVYILQFLKASRYSEHDTLDKYFKDKITWEQFGSEKYIVEEPLPEHFEAVIKGFTKAKEILKSEEYDVVILDEIIVALFFKTCTVEQILELMDMKPRNVELILTGRKAPQELIDRADLVTEMKEIKHYYQQGIEARKGIEN